MNDPLVHLNPERRDVYQYVENEPLKNEGDLRKILKTAAEIRKQSGVNPLCIVKETVNLMLEGSECRVPLFLYPISHKIDKNSHVVSLDVLDDWVLNPVFERYLRSYDLVPDAKSHESYLEVISNHGKTLENEQFIGCFHHHRYLVLKELEELSNISELSEALKRVLTSEGGKSQISLPDSFTLPADINHRKALELAKHDHLVIQGPPGTGKSQVLTNLICQSVSSHLSTLIVSEKRAALEVISVRLRQLNLASLSFIDTDTASSKDLLQNLEATWSKFESSTIKSDIAPQISQQFTDQIKRNIDFLLKEDIVGGISVDKFNQIYRNHTVKNSVFRILSSLIEFESSSKSIEIIIDHKLGFVCSFIKGKSLSGISDSLINSWKVTLKGLQVHFSIKTWSDLAQAMKEAADHQVLENESFKKHLSIFNPNSKTHEQFQTAVKRYRKELGKQHTWDLEWTEAPSSLECDSLIEALNNGNYFKKRTAKKRWSQLTNASHGIALETLKSWKTELKRREGLERAKAKLSELGIQEPQLEIEQIEFLKNRFSAEKWEQIFTLSKEERNHFTKHHDKLNRLYQDLRTFFIFDDSTDLDDFIARLSESFSLLEINEDHWSSLPTDLRRALRDVANFDELKSIVATSHWNEFESKFPQYAKFQRNDFGSQIEEVNALRDVEARNFAEQILTQSVERFNSYNRLLETPARKLSDSEKTLKQRLRKGKSILVKEFRKTRSHPTVRELFESEAAEWIRVLKPIWLSNPTQIGRRFPMEKELFDLVVFDESSQVLLRDSLGALHRAKRVVIAGDEHQMGPSNYFQRGESEPIDLLHQASFYLPSTMLKHHYRSSHPALISFSNQRFYENKLVTYPSFGQNESLIFHKVDGVFEDRCNKQESGKVIDLLESRLKQQGTIGVVAFSETQLNLIQRSIPSSMNKLIQERVDSGELFFRSLENVQGDECDHLIISFGYGKNTEGEFTMRFGPMNQANGIKRLNVLVTRAKQSLDFVASVSSQDFKISDNPSVDLIRNWFIHIENHKPEQDYQFPYDLDTEISGSNLTIKTVEKSIKNEEDLITLHGVLKSRGWSINYV